MPIYATIEDLAGYADGVEAPASGSPEEASLNKTIERAERQIDGVISWAGDPDTDNHRRVDVADPDLDPMDRQALRLATCAQAAYRLEMGEAWFLRDQHQSVAGPGFRTEGTLSRISPAALEELALSIALVVETVGGMSFEGGTAYAARYGSCLWED